MRGNIGVVSRSGNSERRPKVLLTVLGLNPRPACYTFEATDAVPVEAPLAPAALFDLMPEEEQPDLLLAVCTEAAARDSWPLLERELSVRCELKCIEVANGETRENIAAFLEKVLEKVTAAVPKNADLTVDVTHGFRHFSFLTYGAVLYLSALGSVRVRGAYYGLLSDDSVVRFLDLRPLLILPDWIHALRVLNETGSAEPMAELLPDAQNYSGLKRNLSRLSEAYLSGLPVEFGMQSDRVLVGLKQLKRVLRSELELPLSEELTNRLGSTVERFAFKTPVGVRSYKGKIALSERELVRQARLIDDLLERGNLAVALGLMNEWTMSWVLLRKGWSADWLDYKVRRKATGLLGALRAVVEHHPDLRSRLSSEQESLGEFWRCLSSMRNAFHHHGMRRQDLVGDHNAETAVVRIREYWRETLCDVPDFPLSLGGSSGGRILVSPIGKRPGVLFSALHACREAGGMPDTLLVICSSGSEAGIAEAAGKAGYVGELERLRFEDPYGGLEEIKRLKKAARHWLFGAEDVLVNVTGGTTLIGLAAEELATTARDLACPTVRRFGLVDRRPPVEQDAKPYMIGEPFWLDYEQAENAD